MSDIRVLVVDDSAFMRKVISDIIDNEAGMKVIGTARNGQEALTAVKSLQPDVITMDVEMPVMDGLQALEKIMNEDPLPVIMLSSITQKGADATMRALYLGAVDFIPKPSGSLSLDIKKVSEDIVRKIKVGAATRNRLKKPVPTPIVPQAKKAVETVKVESVSYRPPSNLVLIGTSTGGPKALHEVIPKLPRDLQAAVLVVQHMPPGFTKSLADRLNSMSVLKVKEAESGDVVSQGCVYIAPGDFHLKTKRLGDGLSRRLVIELTKDALVSGHRPSVDAMIECAVNQYWSKIIAVIMTGMGQDGAKATTKVKSAGGRVIAEDSSTCIVYGMPKAVVDLGNADKVIPLPHIARAITDMV